MDEGSSRRRKSGQERRAMKSTDTKNDKKREAHTDPHTHGLVRFRAHCQHSAQPRLRPQHLVEFEFHLTKLNEQVEHWSTLSSIRSS